MRAMLIAVPVRFICQICGIKWFVPPGSTQPPPQSCAGCGGPLAVLDSDEPRPSESFAA